MGTITFDEFRRTSEELLLEAKAEASHLPKPPQLDLAVVACAPNQRGLILWVNEFSGLYYEIDALGLEDVSELIMDPQAPDHGIWIWDGKVHYFFSGPDGEPDSEYHVKEWRRPTEGEWNRIKQGENPFDTQLENGNQFVL